MSAPKTNIEKQERRHAGPLIGIGAAIVFGLIILIAYFFFITDDVEDGDVEADAVVVEPATDG